MRFSGLDTPPRGGAMAGRDDLGDELLDTPILIVEDEALIAWMLEGMFEDMGFTTIAIAATGEDAVASAARRAPGLIVSDINLGKGMDGVAAAAMIRASVPAPVLFVSGYAGADTRVRIDRDVPGAAVMRKPIQSHDLRRAVVEALRRGRLQ